MHKLLLGAVLCGAAISNTHAAQPIYRMCSPVVDDRTLNGTNFHADNPPQMQMVCIYRTADGATEKEILIVPMRDRPMMAGYPAGPLPTSCDDGSCR